MKRIIIALMFLLGISSFACGQMKVKKDSIGNFVPVESKKEPVKTGQSLSYKGKSYPVYKASTGRLFIIRTSRSGSTYRQYLTVED